MDDKEEKVRLLEVLISLTSSKEVENKIRELFKLGYPKCRPSNFNEFVYLKDKEIIKRLDILIANFKN
jgi:hypothetical protein